LLLGFDHYETVVIIYLIQAASVVSAVLFRYESDTTVALLYGAGVATLFCALTVAERRGWRVPGAHGAASRLTRAITTLRSSKGLMRAPLLTITAITPAVMVLSALFVRRIPSDLAAGAAVLAIVPAVQLLWPGKVQPVLLRLAIYGAAVVPAYFLISYPGAIPHGMQFLTPGVILVLAAAIVTYVRFSAEQRFGTTPTDYLIVCGVIALTVFGSIEVNSRNVVEAVLFATVLMYACEILIGGTPGSSGRRLLQYSTLGTLLIITVRGVV
jgi:UDP-GlcNAc:undecaprenyl-phosphate GlcNAc-1-phosphate transferase